MMDRALLEAKAKRGSKSMFVANGVAFAVTKYCGGYQHHVDGQHVDEHEFDMRLKQCVKMEVQRCRIAEEHIANLTKKLKDELD